MSIFPKLITLKTEEVITIREARAEDAASVIQYVNRVGGESDFLTFGKNEFKKTVEEEIKIFEDYQKSKNQIFLLAELNGEVVSLMNLMSSTKPRLEHLGEFGLSVSKLHWGKGIGRAMLLALIEWARQTNMIRKINLRVMTSNASAIHLYESLGFEKEGCLRRDMLLHGQFHDAYNMGLLID